MLVSKFFIATLKEAPADAELISHQLMIRAGLIKRLGAGLYSWMPLGLRVLRKIETIVREEMNRSDAIELLMPAVIPAELWQETKRWEVFGPQMLKIKDRHDRDFCFGPTHEEVITDIVRKEISSHKQLPVHFYQIQTKFRDEIRPRFGVMRAREFVMKDGYSFHTSKDSLQATYQLMYQTYTRIFTRTGLQFRVVSADTGAIGGTGSHEFHVLAESGEDAIAFNPTSDYAANVEIAEAIATPPSPVPDMENLRQVATPTQTTCQEVASLLDIPLQQTVKLLAIIAGQKLVAVLLRGDHQLNEIKLSKIDSFSGSRFASEAEIQAAFDCPAGFLGPVGLDRSQITVIADRAVIMMHNFVCGANQSQYHLAGVNWHRDLPPPDAVYDLRNVVSGDLSPDGQGYLEICRGIEVGHIFQLGNKYSQAMRATFLDQQGKSQVMEMGCYGIGVSRIVGAAIEQNHDDRGIIFPAAIAPFHVAIAPIGYHRDPEVRATAIALHDELEALGIEVLLDDRNERPGIMFADLELIGIPHRITVSSRKLQTGQVEYLARTETTPRDIPTGEIIAFMQATR